MSEQYYTLKIAGLERQLKRFPVSDTLDIAAFILFGDVELTEACAKELLKKAPEFDYIVTPEAKSIPLANISRANIIVVLWDRFRRKVRRISMFPCAA